MQKKWTAQSVAALLLCGVLAAFMLSIGVKLILRNVLHVQPVESPTFDASVHAVEIDWAGLYPFAEGDIAPKEAGGVEGSPL